MALVSLLFKRTNVMIDAIEVDVSLSEQHVSEVEITEHPVEIGTNIVDHARPKPDVLTIEGVISNDALPLPDAVLNAHEEHGQRFTTRSTGQPQRAGIAYDDLRALKDAAKLITVVTSLVTYDNMMLRSLSAPRDPRTGQTLRFSATFVHVRVVSTKTVALAATPKKSGGKKAAPPATAAQKKTVLKDLADTTGATQVLGSFLGR